MMGYREDVLFIYSKEGWVELWNKINSNFVSDDDRANVINFISSNDHHQESNDKDHLLGFYQIKTYRSEVELLVGLSKTIDENQWMIKYLGEDGQESADGGYYDNPFKPSVEHTLRWNDGVNVELEIPTNNPIVIAAAPIVDDYTCGCCGNTKCSTQEKSCWKCGTPIV